MALSKKDFRPSIRGIGTVKEMGDRRGDDLLALGGNEEAGNADQLESDQ